MDLALGSIAATAGGENIPVAEFLGKLFTMKNTIQNRKQLKEKIKFKKKKSEKFIEYLINGAGGRPDDLSGSLVDPAKSSICFGLFLF